MLARYKEDGKYYALKILKKASIIENDERDSIVAEKNVFSLVSEENHPFLVSCHGIYQNDVISNLHTHACRLAYSL
jgi:serine/threonine protein kinase